MRRVARLNRAREAGKKTEMARPYAGPIIDAHHHFWEPERGRQPWLRPETSIPFRYGNYEVIKRPYLPSHLRRDAEGLNLTGSVSMETEWESGDSVGEMRHTQQVAERFGLPSAAVAHAVLDDPAVDSALEALADMPLVRGIRHKPGGCPRPELAGTSPSKLVDPTWLRGFGRLVNYGLSFDLQVAWWHLAEAAGVAAAHPEQLIILNHAGLPRDRSQAEIEAWRAAIVPLSKHENVVVKISGLGVPGSEWTPNGNRVIVETVAEAFGVERLMFASNFPVDSLVATYHEIYDGFMQLSGSWSETEQHAAFAVNAQRVYRLPDSLANPN